MEKYKLPDLPYAYDALAPYMSQEVLKLHHDKHHAGYVSAANALLDKIDTARKSGEVIDFKSALKTLSFNVGGHILHETFWKVMAPANTGNSRIKGEVLKAIEKEFGSFERFKTEFTETAKSVEGSGWAILAFHKEHGENGALSIIQVEKHNVNFYPEQTILLCLDVWEHAYYLDYKNDRAKFIENWWNIVNWEEVEKRFASK
ncbi:MAG: superoxide dismutase [Candidatus Staskawiczbacteria bacterium RIFOXYD1_FULL_39_28]|uniref:Superoxide dismutase n=1 Tax=Candidatus Staskawiczbacteria bacterium RIFOXYC1_FULL_38_18 TaxID=1802229 RepID=A0A1G2JCT5_9BACT|nr:MAG: superoxide dismutase [Candidatus Staskawiczbacteria bacterium RIFOXYC1_FULL_38_18]OGZ90313.1 MAG: superoxide dismutase [Candidatus Staskawiczbacteria bacterium RIFOXYD1_FULL_39_28]